jgi:hypothetical protein
MLYTRNPWGTGQGEWQGKFSDEDEAWDDHKGLKTLLNYEFNVDDNWWMSFENWKEHFNRLYVCKIFPESWSQFSIQGEWKGTSNGGSYPVEAEDVKKEETKVDKKKEGGVKMHAIDTNDKWFNNPQYRLTVHKKTTVIISLMQEDVNTPLGKPYIPVNFMVVRVKSKKDRLWEVRKEDIVLNAGVGANRLG